MVVEGGEAVIDFRLLRPPMRIALEDNYFVFLPGRQLFRYKIFTDPFWIDRGAVYGDISPRHTAVTYFSSRRVKR